MRIKIIFISVLVLIGAYSFFWFYLADQAKETTLSWIENSEERLEGIKLYVGDVTVSGFPYKIAVEATTFNASVPAGLYGKNPILISFPNIAAVYQPWKPNHAIIVSEYMDAVIGELDNPEVSISLETIMSSVIFDIETEELNNLSITSDIASWQHGIAGEGLEVSVIEKPEFHLRRTTGNSAEQVGYDLPVNRAVYFKAENALINEFKDTVLGESADLIKIETLLHANEQPDYTVAGLSQWRDDGGTVSIRSFDYGTADQNMSLSGDMTLDGNLKPLGAFDASVTGIGGLFGRLSENKNLSSITRSLLKSQANNNQLPDAVPLAISMQNGQMYVGPIMIMELPAVID
ncbi:MAG: DUF2125 domain-containing protein [Emcibacteraceae bacterium]|nr:DUF2125 domain-containing protein [Emcibacteraceae bacterium]MDG1995285.1 DUF2125 domain-containing protein [Emcibacteraceae bacterium]